MNKRGIAPIVIVIALFVIVAAVLVFLDRPGGTPSPIACTQEAKLCPDGSYVGRTGPNCEFAPCPEPTPFETTVYLREGEQEGSFLLEKIYPDRLEGINYMEYPVPRDEGFPLTLKVGEPASNGCTIALTLVGIEGSRARFIKKTDYNRPCPICLAQGTLINTLNGQIAVQNLRADDLVWTINAGGEKVVAPIIRVSKTRVTAGHQVLEINLSDGRALTASAGHPTIDSRTLGELRVGEILDGAKIISIIALNYDQNYTYDILPAGPTGFYWANGILLGSSLAK